MEHQHKLPHSHSKKRSMSDTESQTSQADSFYSPLRYDSPLRSVGPDKWPEKSPPSKAIVAVNKYNFPVRSPTQNHRKAFATQENLNPPAGSLPPPPPLMVVNRAVRDEVAAGVTKVGPTMVEEGFGGDERRSREVVASTMNRAALGFRVCEMILCLISFSVMAADKTQGWTGDSFDRYIEYRFCVAVTVIGFAYSGFQAYDLAYHLITGKHVISHHLRYHFDFLMDQILAYLLMSASSSAATRVIDWVSNWGKDEFTEMASASIGMSFLAFAAFALSSLISGYNLCNRDIA